MLPLYAPNLLDTGNTIRKRTAGRHRMREEDVPCVTLVSRFSCVTPPPLLVQWCTLKLLLPSPIP
eukprot:1581728-Pleurochrysis_carterae.AAC.2